MDPDLRQYQQRHHDQQPHMCFDVLQERDRHAASPRMHPPAIDSSQQRHPGEQRSRASTRRCANCSASPDSLVRRQRRKSGPPVTREKSSGSGSGACVGALTFRVAFAASLNLLAVRDLAPALIQADSRPAIQAFTHSTATSATSPSAPTTIAMSTAHRPGHVDILLPQCSQVAPVLDRAEHERQQADADQCETESARADEHRVGGRGSSSRSGRTCRPRTRM